MARLTATTRKKSATVHVNGKAKFPEPDKSHAVQAIRFENRADPPLTDKQRHTVEARAAKFGVGPLATKKKKAAATKKGKKS